MTRRALPRLRLQVQQSGPVSIAPLDVPRLRRLVVAVLEQPLDLTLRFVARAEAVRLNADYRRAKYAPGVLTFDYPDQASADVVICPPVVRDEARQRGIPFAHHLSHMVVHGALHAQGYTHDEPGPAEQMEAIERLALARFGIADPYR